MTEVIPFDIRVHERRIASRQLRSLTLRYLLFMNHAAFASALSSIPLLIASSDPTNTGKVAIDRPSTGVHVTDPQSTAAAMRRTATKFRIVG